MESHNWLFLFQLILNGAAAIACLLLATEYIYIVHIRKPPYPWAAYAISLALILFACDRLLLLQLHTTDSGIALFSRSATNLIILLCA
jgi:hypothetical protein